MKKIYHVYTNGLAKDLWFLDEEDFKSGMNSVPSCALVAEVCIYCFCLMSNHVHFILKGEEENCIRFIREYKRQRSKQISRRYGDSHSLIGSDAGIKLIDTEDYLKTAIAYVLRNPLAAGLGILPSGYRWSSGNIYFSERAFCQDGFRKLEKLSMSKKRRMFKTRMDLPGEYLVDYTGVIFPGSYVDYTSVEKIYRSPKHFLYHLSSTRDMEEELESGILAKVRYTDTELKASMNSLCSEKYSGRSYYSLRIEERFIIARLMHKRYGVGAKQLARVTSLDYESLKLMI